MSEPEILHHFGIQIADFRFVIYTFRKSSTSSCRELTSKVILNFRIGERERVSGTFKGVRGAREEFQGLFWVLTLGHAINFGAEKCFREVSECLAPVFWLLLQALSRDHREISSRVLRETLQLTRKFLQEILKEFLLKLFQ